MKLKIKVGLGSVGDPARLEIGANQSTRLGWGALRYQSTRLELGET